MQGYVEVLEDLLLSFRVPVFSRRARRLLVAHPKFFFFDAGVFRSVQPGGPLDRPGARFLTQLIPGHNPVVDASV